MALLTSHVESLQQTREDWQAERQRLATLVEEVQQASKGVELRFASQVAALQAENKRVEAQRKEAEGQLGELRVVQMNRVNEAYAKERQLTEQIGGYQRQIAELQEQLRARWVLRGRVRRRTQAQAQKEAVVSEQEKRVAALESRVKTQLQALAQSTGARWRAG